MRKLMLGLVALLPMQVSALDVVVEAESGPTYFARNEGRYGEGGTLFVASDVGQQRNLVISQRTALEFGVGRSTFILLWAPLDVTTLATLESPLVFRGLTAEAGELVEHRYKFEGFRGSWLFQVLDQSAWKLELGGSLQIRNALVSFRVLPEDTYEVEDDIGVVLALKGRLTYRTDAGPYAMLEADGFSTFGLLSAVSGAIYDVALSLGLPVARPVDLFLRLRLLGGGAEVPRRDIYNWGDFVAASAGIRVDLDALWPGAS